MNKLALNSYAKLNLYLSVLNKRKDSYHNIKTIFERIDLCDKIILESRRDGLIRIISRAQNIPKDSSNLAYHSAQLLKQRFHIKLGVDITIIKNIPVGAGLAGGSSNAAAVLTGLNKLWGLDLSRRKLSGLASNLGSDVPFFVYDASFALGEGRGERIKILRGLSGLRLWHILVVPRLEVSTKFIYEKWDAAVRPSKKTGLRFGRRISEKAGLTSPKPDVKIINLALRKKDFSLMPQALFNSLQEVTAKAYPEIIQVRDRLHSLGLESILMSGSGPAIFGIVPSRKEAVSLRKQLEQGNKSWQVFVTGTV